MRRRLTHTPHFTALLLILTVILSFITVLPAKSPSTTANPETNTKIVDMLKLLRGNVTDLDKEDFGNIPSWEGRQTALKNKISAVIHQIEAEAFSGSLNKLHNDVNRTVTEWILPYSPQDAEILFELIFEIMKLIRGIVLLSPKASFFFTPKKPLAGETVTFNASASEDPDGIIVSYTWDFGDDTVITVSDPTTTHIYDTYGTYTVSLTVMDNDSLTDISTADITIYALPVAAFPPEIIGVFRVPEEPNYDEYVRIFASVIDIDGEVESVILGYSTNNIDWTNLTMIFNENIGFYTAEIPPQPYNTTVNYKVYASDNIGNWSVSNTYSYTVGDKYLPIVEIEEPTDGSYLGDLVNITVSVQEDNLVEAKLAINSTAVSMWHESGKHVFTWNTSSPDYPDGTYIIELSASDKADNSAEKTVTVTIDNTLPTATINAPLEGAFLRRTVFIEITGEDVNLDKIELKINDSVIKTWSTGGKHIYLWNTRAYSDGTYEITLTVYDKAVNSKEIFITIFVDNTEPTIEAPTWKPEEPSINDQVNVTLKVSDRQPSSGIQNVTLWYRNTTIDWQPVPMSLNVTSGNWTATIPAQSTETTIKFYIEAFDNAGNKAVSDEIYEYKAIAPAGIPLAWIVAIILLILAATATAIYFWRKRKREKQGSSSSRVENYKLTLLLCF